MATPQLTPIEFEALTWQLQEEEFFDLFAPRQPQDEPQQIRNVPTEPDVSSPQVRSQEEAAFPSVGMVPRQPATMDQAGPTPQYPAERPMSFPTPSPIPSQGMSAPSSFAQQSNAPQVGDFGMRTPSQAAPSLGSLTGPPSIPAGGNALSSALAGPTSASRGGTEGDERELVDAIEDLIDEVKRLRQVMEKENGSTGNVSNGFPEKKVMRDYPPVRPASASPSRG